MRIIFEQAERRADGAGFRYSWALQGVSQSAGRANLSTAGWQWCRGVGCAGCWLTFDQQAAASIAAGFNVPIESNDTHRYIGAPGILCQTAPAVIPPPPRKAAGLGWLAVAGFEQAKLLGKPYRRPGSRAAGRSRPRRS